MTTAVRRFARREVQKLATVSNLNEKILVDMDQFEHAILEKIEHEWSCVAKQMSSRSHVLWIEQYFYPVHIHFWRKPLLHRLIQLDLWEQYAKVTLAVFAELSEQQLDCCILSQLIQMYQRVFIHLHTLAMQNLFSTHSATIY